LKLIRIGPSAFAHGKSLVVIAIQAVLERIQERASRSGSELEHSLMDHDPILDFGETASTISLAAIWQI
jgi:hypothetical protein